MDDSVFSIKDLLQIEDSSPSKEGDETVWRLPDGTIHRRYGPAVAHACGHKEWKTNGVYHREDGPAIEQADGSYEWYKHGERHRKDGPAVVKTGEFPRYFVEGDELSEEEFLSR